MLYDKIMPPDRIKHTDGFM